MTQVFKCDWCEAEASHMEVTTKGIPPVKGGRILLPDRCFKKDFCSVECFGNWFSKHYQEKETGETQ